MGIRFGIIIYLKNSSQPENSGGVFNIFPFFFWSCPGKADVSLFANLFNLF